MLPIANESSAQPNTEEFKALEKKRKSKPPRWRET
jgi:hypothetical protein